MDGKRDLPLPRFRIERNGPPGNGSRVFLDGVELPGVAHVNVSMGINAAQQVTVVFAATSVEMIDLAIAGANS